MKKEHKKLISEKIPKLIPKLQKLLDKGGLGDFRFASFAFLHKDVTLKCNDQQEPCYVLEGDQYVWKCVPKGECPAG